MKTENHPYQRNVTLFTFLATITVLAVALVWMTWPYLLGLTMAGVFAVITQPIYQKGIDRGLGKKTTSALLVFVIILLIIVPAFFFMSAAMKQALSVSQSISKNELFSPTALIAQISGWQVVEIIGASPEEMSLKIHEWIQSGSTVAAAKVVSIIALMPGIVLNLVMGFVSYFFLLIDGKRFLLWLGQCIPFDKHVGEKVITSLKDTTIASIWATVVAGIAQALVLFIGYLVLGVPGSILAAIATFIFSWIPILGTTPVWIIGAFYLLAEHSPYKVFAMILFGIAAGLVDNFIHPYVLKGRSHLHPLVALISIFGGIGLFGIMGIFLGPILASVMIVLLEAWPEIAKRFKIIS